MQSHQDIGELDTGFLEQALQIGERLEKALRNNEPAESILADLSDAAYIKNSASQILYANRKHVELFSPNSSPVGKAGTAYLSEDMIGSSRLSDAMLFANCDYVLLRHFGHDSNQRGGQFLTYKHSLKRCDHPAFAIFGITRLVAVQEAEQNHTPASLGQLWDRYLLLSETDRVMAKHLSHGLSPREIAGMLGVSPRQVELRRKGILNHLSLTSPTQLTILFVRFQDRGYIDFGL